MVSTPSDEERQRFPIQQKLVVWLRDHVGETFTLSEASESLGRGRGVTASALNRLLENNVMPGFTRVARGVYRYDPPARAVVSKPKSRPADVTIRQFGTRLVGEFASARDGEPVAELEPVTKRRFTEVGMVGRSAVVIVDADGNLWRAERLK
jgi:hypothetical protein